MYLCEDTVVHCQWWGIKQPTLELTAEYVTSPNYCHYNNSGLLIDSQHIYFARAALGLVGISF